MELTNLQGDFTIVDSYLFITLILVFLDLILTVEVDYLLFESHGEEDVFVHFEPISRIFELIDGWGSLVTFAISLLQHL
jgi:hypothetical protein